MLLLATLLLSSQQGCCSCASEGGDGWQRCPTGPVLQPLPPAHSLITVVRRRRQQPVPSSCLPGGTSSLLPPVRACPFHLWRRYDTCRVPAAPSAAAGPLLPPALLSQRHHLLLPAAGTCPLPPSPRRPRDYVTSLLSLSPGTRAHSGSAAAAAAGRCWPGRRASARPPPSVPHAAC